MQFFTCQQLHYTCSANYLPELVYKLSAGFLCPHFLQYESVKISKPSFFLMCRRDRRYTYMVLRKCPFRFQIIFLFTDDRFFFYSRLLLSFSFLLSPFIRRRHFCFTHIPFTQTFILLLYNDSKLLRKKMQRTKEKRY